MKVGQWPVLVQWGQAMPWRAARSGLLLLCALLMASPVLQADSSSTVPLPLPAPLTLVDAWSLANESHPDCASLGQMSHGPVFACGRWNRVTA